MLTEKEFKKYNQYYFEQFGHEADINQSRGSYSDYILKIVDAIINKTVSQLESIGAEESIIEATIKSLEEGSSFDALNMFKGYIFSIVFYTVFGLLVAAFTKNENQEFSE